MWLPRIGHGPQILLLSHLFLWTRAHGVMSGEPQTAARSGEVRHDGAQRGCHASFGERNILQEQSRPEDMPIWDWHAVYVNLTA